MPSIHGYIDFVELLLEESVKYFALLLFAVLAIRLWRRTIKTPRGRKLGASSLALSISGLAVGIGYFSFCHSMGLMYAHFGTRAFYSYQLQPALSLFQTSLKYWKSPDALGGKGICLLWTGNTQDGLQLLREAKALRKGENSPFENFYAGLYFFYRDDVTNAVPLLEAAWADAHFEWDATKLLAVIQLDRNEPQEAKKLMQPFMQAAVTEPDQAYVIAALKLADGKTNEALMLVNQSLTNHPTPYWKARLETLSSNIDRKNP